MPPQPPNPYSPPLEMGPFTPEQLAAFQAQQAQGSATLAGYLPGYPAQTPPPPTAPLGAIPGSTVAAQPSGPHSGGLDFGALATERQGESESRIGGLAGFLELLLAEQRRRGDAEQAAGREGNDRERSFRGTQAQTDRDHQAAMASTSRAFQERQAALNRRINESLGRGQGEPTFWEQLEAETSAKERLMMLEAQLAQAGQQGPGDPLAEMVAQMGGSEINAYRGDFLRREPGRTSVRQSQGPQWQQTLGELSQYIADAGGDPMASGDFFRQRGYGRSADERASLALADLGWYLR